MGRVLHGGVEHQHLADDGVRVRDAAIEHGVAGGRVREEYVPDL